MSAATQAVVLCGAGRGSPLRTVAGVTLLERLLRQLGRRPGVREILVVAPPDPPLPSPSAWVRVPVRHEQVGTAPPWEMLRAVRSSLHERFLVVGGDLLVDQRLFASLEEATESTLVQRDGTPEPEVLGSLQPAALDTPAGSPPRARILLLSDLPTFSDHLRGEIPVHLLPIDSDADAEAAWSVLLDSVEKRTKDLPAEYIDPPLENALVRWFARTRVTPNQITVFSTALGFLIALLFWKGWLVLGILLAFAVEILDGVDGKLARIKHMTSRFGEFEHVFDFFYENAWYLGIGAHLADTGSAWAWGAAWLIVAFDLADNLVYTFYEWRHGRHLDQSSLFLQRFRLVGGRRNIYAWMFAPGFFLGAPGVSFAAAVVWAGITATVHAGFAFLGGATDDSS
jgi:phosphatidylglycerophosphate synthase